MNIKTKQKKIHFFQHVDFEGPSTLADIVTSMGYEISVTKFYEEGWKFPSQNEYELLVVLGGPMGSYEEDKYPFLLPEKSFIRAAIFHGKKVLGICLGAQLIANSLGAKVYPGPEKEIGWFPVQLSAVGSGIFTSFPDKVMHWHGDTFDLPEGAIRISSSPLYKNQAFLYLKNVLALQFHLELSEASIERLIEEGLPAPGNYVSTAEEIREGMHRIESCTAAMKLVLMGFFGLEQKL